MSATAEQVTVQDLLPEAADYVYTLFKEHLPDTILFHGYQHTVDVVEAALKICRKTDDVAQEDKELLHMAALFHDTGFIETYDGHEEVSARIAKDFLSERGLPEDDIEQVTKLILATKPEYRPESFLEEAIRDADMAHLGRKNFFERSERLRAEWAEHKDRTYTDQEWLEVQLQFLMTSKYRTEYAQEKYGKRKRKNVKSLRRRLAVMLDKPKAIPQPPEDKGVPKRGKETLFRATYRNHINLSSIADAKANIMISINAILMSIIVSFVSTRITDEPYLIIPASILLFASLIATVFAILSARPKVTSKSFSLEDVRENQANILFFGNFVNLSLDDFKVGIREVMSDWDRLYDSMSHDLHSLGLVLQKKYRLLWISYTVFMVGLVASVIALVICYIWEY